MFLGRNETINSLNSLYESENSLIAVLYGQDGVGVSTVCNEFIKDKTSIVISAHKACDELNRRFICKSLIEAGVKISEEIPSYTDMFEAVLARPYASKLVLVIDGFDILAKCNDSFYTSLFQFVKENKNDNSIMVLLVTKSIGYVENQMVTKMGKGAFGISGFVKLKPLHFLDLVCFFKNINDTQTYMAIYSIFGGLSGFWNAFDEKLSLKENIIAAFLKDYAPFRKAGIDAIMTELREPGVYSTILCAMAEGKNKLNEIYKYTGFSRAKISVYIKNLMSLSLAAKVNSVETAGDLNAMKGVYEISNPVLKFWFTFIYPNESKIKTLGPDKYYDTYIAPYIDDYVKNIFPDVCVEFMDILNSKDGLPIKYTKKGKWVGKAGTIHLVAWNDDRIYLTGYCCTDKNICTAEDYEWYEFCLKEAHIKTNYNYIFSIDGFDDKLRELAASRENINLIEMKDF